jgi:hypothetical protein
MGYSRFDPAMQARAAWNAGKTVSTKRPLTQKQIWAIRFHLDREGRLRDKALFDLAIDSKLRGCDLVKIKIGDVVAGADVRTRAIVIQQKTSRPVQFELTSDVRATLLSWLERRCGSITDYLFPSRIDHAGHMSTRQYARLVDEWVTAIESRDDLPRHGQHPRDPDFTGSHQDRKYRSLSRGRRRRRLAAGGAHRNLIHDAVDRPLRSTAFGAALRCADWTTLGWKADFAAQLCCRATTRRLTGVSSLLDRWARHVAIGAENAAIALQGTHLRLAMAAVIEEPTGVGGHCLFGDATTIRTCNG